MSDETGNGNGGLTFAQRVELAKIPARYTLIGIALGALLANIPDIIAALKPEPNPTSIPAPTQTVRISETKTPTVTPTSSVTPTPSPTLKPSMTPVPTVDPFASTGNCDSPGIEQPCTKFNPASWDSIGYDVFGQAERCRWPEIANVNRLPNGRYNQPLPDDVPIFIPPVAPGGMYQPRMRLEFGDFVDIPACSGESGKPCVVPVAETITDTVEAAYCKIARLEGVYGYCTLLVAQTLANQNIDSLCQWPLAAADPITLDQGTLIVIPSKLDNRLTADFLEE